MLFVSIMWLCKQIKVPTTWVIPGPHANTLNITFKDRSSESPKWSSRLFLLQLAALCTSSRLKEIQLKWFKYIQFVVQMNNILKSYPGLLPLADNDTLQWQHMIYFPITLPGSLSRPQSGSTLQGRCVICSRAEVGEDTGTWLGYWCVVALIYWHIALSAHTLHCYVHRCPANAFCPLPRVTSLTPALSLFLYTHNLRTELSLKGVTLEQCVVSNFSNLLHILHRVDKSQCIFLQLRLPLNTLIMVKYSFTMRLCMCKMSAIS